MKQYSNDIKSNEIKVEEAAAASQKKKKMKRERERDAIIYFYIMLETLISIYRLLDVR